MSTPLSAKFTRWLSRHRSATRPHRAGFRPALEALEDRLAPATLTVTKLGDDGADMGTLRYAVDHAESGDTIRIAPQLAGQGPIVLTGSELLLNKDLTIEGLGAAAQTVSGNDSSRVFEVTSDAHVVLRNLMVVHGYAEAGGGIYSQGTLTVSRCTVSSNLAWFEGGGISSHGTLTVDQSIVSDNTTGGLLFDDFSPPFSYQYREENYGGGIFSLGTATITNSTVTRNANLTNSLWNIIDSYPIGGGISSAGSLTVEHCTVSANFVEGGRGAGIDQYGTLTVRHSEFRDQTYTDAIYAVGSTSIDHCTFAHNASAISAAGGPITISHSTFSSNSYYGIRTGGSGTIDYCLVTDNLLGIDNGGTLTVSNCKITDNVGQGGVKNSGTLLLSKTKVAFNAAQKGGGVSNSGTLTVEDCQVHDNTAMPLPGQGFDPFAGFGGGIYSSTGPGFLSGQPLAQLTVRDSSMLNNHATQGGGGIANTAGIATVLGSTILGNSAVRGGGIDNSPVFVVVSVWNGSGYDAVLHEQDSTLTVVDSQVTGNTASSAGGGLFNYRSDVTLLRSTIGGNTAASGGGLLTDQGTVVLNHTSLTGNSAEFGGGLYNFYGTVTLNSSTVSRNTARSGGGILNEGGALLLYSSVVTKNTATEYGGGIYNFFGTMNIDPFSSVARNSAPNGPDLFLYP